MPLGRSMSVPSLNRIVLTDPELGRLQFSIDRQLKVAIFTFFEGEGGQISNFIFLTPKGTSLAGATHNGVLIVGMCAEIPFVGETEKGRKDRNFHASNWPRPPMAT